MLSRDSGRLSQESFERRNHLFKITQLDTESLNPGPFAFPDKGEPTISACSAAGHPEQPLSHLSPHKSPQPWSSPERISNIQFLGSRTSHESVTATWPQGILREPGAVRVPSQGQWRETLQAQAMRTGQMGTTQPHLQISIWFPCGTWNTHCCSWYRCGANTRRPTGGHCETAGKWPKGGQTSTFSSGTTRNKKSWWGQSNKRPRWLIQKPVVLTSVLTLATVSTPATCKCLTSSSHLWDMCTKNDHCIRSLKSALPPSPSPHTCPLMISGHGLWKAPACSRKQRCHLCLRKPQQQNPPCHMSELSWLGPVIWKRRLRHVWLSYTCPFGYIRRACNVGREGGSQTLHALSPFWEDAQDHGSWGSCVCKRPDAQKSMVNSPSCPQIWKVSHVPQSFCPGLFRTSVLLPVTLDAPLSSWTPETTACFLWGPCQRPEQRPREKPTSLETNSRNSLQITSPAGQTILASASNFSW